VKGTGIIHKWEEGVNMLMSKDILIYGLAVPGESLHFLCRLIRTLIRLES